MVEEIPIKWLTDEKSQGLRWCMAGFKGQANRSVDSKGRVAIPAKMRAELAPEARNTFTATRGLEQCIVLYPQNRWEEIEKQLMELNTFQRKVRMFVRTIVRWAEEVTLDNQGRIVLPKRLQQFAGVEGTVTVIGQLDCVEVWKPERLQELDEAQDESYDEIAESVMGDLVW